MVILAVRSWELAGKIDCADDNHPSADTAGKTDRIGSAGRVGVGDGLAQTARSRIIHVAHRECAEQRPPLQWLSKNGTAHLANGRINAGL
jgi:hypothetical protein